MARTQPVDPLPIGLRRVIRALNLLGAVWILALMVLINLDILGRTALGMPVRGVSELVALSIVGIVFLQLADTLRAGRFLRADLLRDAIAKRHPRAAAWLDALHHALGAVFMGGVLWAAWPAMVDAWRVGEYVGAYGDFTAPVWPIRLIAICGLALTALTYAWLAWAALRHPPPLRDEGSP